MVSTKIILFSGMSVVVLALFLLFLSSSVPGGCTTNDLAIEENSEMDCLIVEFESCPGHLRFSNQCESTFYISLDEVNGCRFSDEDILQNFNFKNVKLDESGGRIALNSNSYFELRPSCLTNLKGAGTCSSSERNWEINLEAEEGESAFISGTFTPGGDFINCFIPLPILGLFIVSFALFLIFLSGSLIARSKKGSQSN